ncbi:hypothetical protein DRP77_02480 [Candidatus Poribacteria bacterium]|nr:MAG: hypothetical protein DRP77_02480 [Candidatus Poribacteria bacterium]
MRICKIFQGDYPWDVRVEKIAKALARFGHEVHLLCRNTRGETCYEEIDGFHIHRLPVLTSSGKLNDLLSYPWPLNPFWIIWIRKAALLCRADALLVRDLPLSLTAVIVGRSEKLPVILDMAENYPAAMADWRRWERGFEKMRNSVVRNIWAARRIEDLVLKAVDHVIVVAEESRERLIEKGLPCSRISIVGNTPDLRFFSPARSPEPDLAERFAGRFVISYIGEILMHRGLDIAVKAMPRIIEAIPNACLLLVGDGKRREREQLKRLASDLGVRGHVVFEGWVEFARVPDYIKVSDVCVVPHRKTEHVNTTLPNKLFDYMALGKPVVVSDAAPLKRIVEQEGCGLSFASGDAAEFAQAVLKLKSEEIRRKLGGQGMNAVMRRYNWEVDSRVLAGVFEALEGRRMRS